MTLILSKGYKKNAPGGAFFYYFTTSFDVNVPESLKSFRL